MSPEINRILVLFLLVGSALAVSASLLLMRLYRKAMQKFWQTAAVYTVAGTCYALIVTIGWLAAPHDRAVVWTKVAFLFWLYLWPTVIAVVLVAAYNPARHWRLFATYFVVFLSLSGIALV